MQTWSKKVKTNKPHKCWGCGYEFKPGTEMDYVTSIDGDTFHHSYWCPICSKVWDMVGRNECDDGLNLGELKEFYPDEWGMVYADTVADAT